MILVIWAVLMLVILFVAFMFGRKYERKQFVHIGTKRPTTQDILLGGKK